MDEYIKVQVTRYKNHLKFARLISWSTSFILILLPLVDTMPSSFNSLNGLATWAPTDREIYVNRAKMRAEEGYINFDLNK